MKMRSNNKLYHKKYIKYNPSWHAEDSYFKFLKVKKIVNNNKLKFMSFCEVGCGVGKILFYLSKEYLNKKFYGYEISKKAYSLCNKKQKNVKYYNRPLKKNKKYDIILCADVLEHVENPYKFLKEIKKNSKFQIFHVPIDLSVSSLIRRSVILKARKYVGHLHFYNKDIIFHDLKNLDFEIINHFYTFNDNIFSNGSIGQKIIASIRKFIFSINKDFAVNFLGGFSLMILTK